MWPIITFVVGLLVAVATMVAWWLLSGFGCEMNTAGCSRIRLDTHPDALRIFLPMLAIGAAMMACGVWMRAGGAHDTVDATGRDRRNDRGTAWFGTRSSSG